jgi:hypothetical protein
MISTIHNTPNFRGSDFNENPSFAYFVRGVVNITRSASRAFISICALFTSESNIRRSSSVPLEMYVTFVVIGSIYMLSIEV